jgi:hypothetical protein
MARIKTVSEDTAQGMQLDVIRKAKSVYGTVPGILRIRLADPDLAAPAMQLYQHLNMRPGSPVNRLQREMVAAVVNGLVGGRP